MPPDQDSLRFPLMYESAVIEDKVFAANATGRGSFYIPSEGKWKKGNKDISGDKRGWYVIENVMYCCEYDGRILWCEATELEWCEPEVMEWREVMGLEALRYPLRADRWESCKRQAIAQGTPTTELDDVLPGYKLSNSGPNMLIFWDVVAPENEKLEIWCAEVSLERRKETGQIWGNVEWSEAVMTLDPPRPPHHHHCKVLYSLSLDL